MDYEVHVWHDHAGRIIAWGHAGRGVPLSLKATPLAKPGHEVVTVRLSDEDLLKLPETHYVDLASKRLMRRSGD